MKFLILTTDNTLLKWQSLPLYLATIKRALNSGKNADWTIEVKYQPATPKVVSEKIDHTWLLNHFKPHYSAGYDCVALHYSYKQKVAWGVQPSLRGANPRTDDFLGDFYFWSDEKTERLGYPQFVQTCLHEFAHEYFDDLKLTDITHEYHDKHKDIAPLFATFDWTNFQGKRQLLKKKVSLLQMILDLTKKLQALKKPAVFVEDLQPLVKRQAKAIIDDMLMLGHEVRIVEGYRSKARQEALYAQGRTTPGRIVTNAKPGESLHNYGVAVDFVFRREGYDASKELWETLGTIGERNGFKWGGRWEDFVDRPHFEMTLDYTLKDFQEGRIDWSRYA